jgi:hypothetical protein
MADSLANRLTGLETLSTAELRARWEQAFNRPPPKRASRDLLLRALAYHVQEQVGGSLSKSTRRRLAKLAGRNGENREPISPPNLRLKPGSRLIREWHGVTHSVTVLDVGFDYRSNRYASLSQIARVITGARWSGPRFFGLRKTGSRVREAADGR